MSRVLRLSALFGFPPCLLVVLLLAVAPAARAATAALPVSLPVSLNDRPSFEIATSEIEGASSLFHEISRMSPEQILVIAVGAAAGGYLAETVIESSIVAIVAAVVGAAMANHWYEQNVQRSWLTF